MGRVSARFSENVVSDAPERPVKKKYNLRDMWTPKRLELAHQCASCPFRKGNDDEFGVIVERLNKRYNADGTIEQVRFSVQHEAKSNGDFACHQTAYSSDMELQPDREHRQCPGATAAFKAAGVLQEVP